ncbi:hypothetical protein JXA32_16670 [Candidatus Sumerlaeota bacterium]|nr:hypothetical protein [Candidatus Sumerlaeota bacterium]
MRQEYTPISLFCGLFADKPIEFNPQQLAAWLRSTLPDFDMQPVFPPSHPQIPGDVPQLILMGDQKARILEVAPRKVHLRWTQRIPGPPLDFWFPDFVDLAANVIYKVSEQGWAFNRVGVIITLFRELRDSNTSANARLAEYFFRSNELTDNSHEIHLSVLNRLDEKDFGCEANRWTRIRTLRNNQDGADRGLQIEFDVNTMPEDSHIRTVHDVREFLQRTRNHVENEVKILSENGI